MTPAFATLEMLKDCAVFSSPAVLVFTIEKGRFCFAYILVRASGAFVLVDYAGVTQYRDSVFIRCKIGNS